MRKVLLALGLLCLLVVPQVQSKLFDCTTEMCIYNGTDELWDCIYEDCPEQPDWIQNITQINETTINVTNCSETAMFDYWDGYIEQLDERFNCSFKYHEKEDALESCQKQLADMSDTCHVDTSGLVNRSLYEGCIRDKTNCLNNQEDSESSAWYGYVVAFVVGVAAMWFLNKRERPQKSEVTPSQGETAINSRAITQDAEIAKLRQELEEMRENQSKKSQDKRTSA